MQKYLELMIFSSADGQSSLQISNEVVFGMKVKLVFGCLLGVMHVALWTHCSFKAAVLCGLLSLLSLNIN